MEKLVGQYGIARHLCAARPLLVLIPIRSDAKIIPRGMGRVAAIAAASSLKAERTGSKTYRTRDEAKADVFDYVECFYNFKRRHSTIGYLSPMEYEHNSRSDYLNRVSFNRLQAI